MRMLIFVFALAIVGLAVPTSVDAQCANCDHWMDDDWLHEFDAEYTYEVSQGTGFHNNAQEGKCFGIPNPHEHGTTGCGGEEQEEELLAIYEAVQQGDVFRVHAVVAQSSTIKWGTPNGAIILTSCDGTETGMDVNWFSEDALRTTATVPTLLQ